MRRWHLSCSPCIIAICETPRKYFADKELSVVNCARCAQRNSPRLRYLSSASERGWLVRLFSQSGQTKKIQLRLPANANYQCNLLTTTKTAAAGCVVATASAHLVAQGDWVCFCLRKLLFIVRLSSAPRTSGIILQLPGIG